MKLTKLLMLVGVMQITFLAQGVQAIPLLQVGAPAGTGDTGLYADYQKSLANPTESDTAVTYGDKLFVMGLYKNPVPDPLKDGSYDLLLGGKYTGPPTFSNMADALDWSDFNFDKKFNGVGAVLMATISDGALSDSKSSLQLRVNGQIINPFYSTATYQDGFVMPNPPANHDPVKNKDYLFFNIGNFSATPGAVVNMADESGSATGESKEIGVIATGYDWVHFDVFALSTELEIDATKYRDIIGYDKKGKPIYGAWRTRLLSSIEDTDLSGNPGSHDVTWKNDGGGGGREVVPEPGTIALVGAGLVGLVLYRRKTKA